MSRILTLDHGGAPFKILREETFNDTLLSLPLGDQSCLRVQIKGRTSSGVPHELLNDLEVLAIRYQECRVGVRNVCHPTFFWMPALSAAG